MLDDLIYTGNSVSLMDEFKESMVKEFKMTDIRKMNYFLESEVKQCDEGIFISQGKHVTELHEEFRMSNCNGVKTPMI